MITKMWSCPNPESDNSVAIVARSRQIGMLPWTNPDEFCFPIGVDILSKQIADRLLWCAQKWIGDSEDAVFLGYILFDILPPALNEEDGKYYRLVSCRYAIVDDMKARFGLENDVDEMKNLVVDENQYEWMKMEE